MQSALRPVTAGLAAAAIGLSWRSEPPGTSLFFVTGFPDCEAFRSGWPAQPTLAVTSLAFVGLGLWMIGDSRMGLPARLLIGGTTVGVGVGSFIGHAATSTGARTLDSIAIKLMLVAFISYGLVRHLGGGDERLLWPWWAGAAGAVIAAELLWPALDTPLLGVLIATAGSTAWLAVEDHQRRRLVAGLTILGAAALAWWLGRGQSPFCLPDNVFQLHGGWHILAATGIAFVYSAHRSEVT